MRYVFILVFPDFLDTLYRFIMTEIIGLFTNQHLRLMHLLRGNWRNVVHP
jgi:hypothetical protein